MGLPGTVLGIPGYLVLPGYVILECPMYLGMSRVVLGQPVAVLDIPLPMAMLVVIALYRGQNSVSVQTHYVVCRHHQLLLDLPSYHGYSNT